MHRVVFSVLVLLAGLVPPSNVVAADLTFTPTADAHVNSGSPAGQLRRPEHDESP